MTQKRPSPDKQPVAGGMDMSKLLDIKNNLPQSPEIQELYLDTKKSLKGLLAYLEDPVIDSSVATTKFQEAMKQYEEAISHNDLKPDRQQTLTELTKEIREKINSLNITMEKPKESTPEAGEKPAVPTQPPQEISPTIDKAEYEVRYKKLAENFAEVKRQIEDQSFSANKGLIELQILNKEKIELTGQVNSLGLDINTQSSILEFNLYINELKRKVRSEMEAKKNILSDNFTALKNKIDTGTLAPEEIELELKNLKNEKNDVGRDLVALREEDKLVAEINEFLRNHKPTTPKEPAATVATPEPIPTPPENSSSAEPTEEEKLEAQKAYDRELTRGENNGEFKLRRRPNKKEKERLAKQELIDKINSANDFDQLYDILREIGEINTSRVKYSSDELIATIENYRQEPTKENELEITNGGGLRGKVLDLQQSNNSPQPPEAPAENPAATAIPSETEPADNLADWNRDKFLSPDGDLPEQGAEGLATAEETPSAEPSETMQEADELLRGLEAQEQERAFAAAAEANQESIEIELSPAEKQKMTSEAGNFGLTLENLNEIEGFSELTYGQRRLILENLKQITLGRIQEEGYQNFNEQTSQKSWPKKLWRNITQKYQIAKAEKEVANNLMSGGLETHRTVLEQLTMGIQEMGTTAHEKTDGSLVIDFIPTPDPADSTPETRREVEKFNEIANQIAHIPYEWTLPSATKKQKEEHEKLRQEYNKARREILIGWNTVDIVSLQKAEATIKLNQFANQHPAAEKIILQIKDQAVWQKALNNIVTERGLMFASGYVTRSLFVSLIGTIGLPLAAGAVGGYRGYKRGQDTISRNEKGSRGENKVVNMREELSEISKTLAENNPSLSRQRKIELTDRQTKLKKALEQEKAKNFNTAVGAKSLADKLAKLNEKIESLSPDDEEYTKTLVELKVRTNYTKRKVLDGQVSFGDKDEKIDNQYDLIQTVIEAETKLQILTTVGRSNVEKRLDEILKINNLKLDKKQKAYVRKQIAIGAAYGATFASLGLATKHLIDNIFPLEDLPTGKTGGAAAQIGDETVEPKPTATEVPTPLRAPSVVEASSAAATPAMETMSYDIGSNGDFPTLDQALRRVVTKSFDVGSDKTLQASEGGQIENVLANVREIFKGRSIAGISHEDLEKYATFDKGKLEITDYDGLKKNIIDPLIERSEEKVGTNSPAIDFARETSEKKWQEILDQQLGKNEATVAQDFDTNPVETSTPNSSIVEKTAIKSELEELTPAKDKYPDLEKITIKTPNHPPENIPAPTALSYEKAIMNLGDRFGLSTQAAKQLTELGLSHKVEGLNADGTIVAGGRFDSMTRMFAQDGFAGLFDERGQLDKGQIDIFNNLYDLKARPEVIKTAINFTDRLQWEPARELALAKALAFPDKAEYWQAVFGKDLIPNSPKVVEITKKGDLWLKKIDGVQGSIVIDPTDKKIMLTNIYDRTGRFAQPARAFSFKKQSFAEALAKTREVIMSAKNS